jgi:hypothetical protein
MWGLLFTFLSGQAFSGHSEHPHLPPESDDPLITCHDPNTAAVPKGRLNQRKLLSGTGSPKKATQGVEPL